jgi:hypothetical protein
VKLARRESMILLLPAVYNTSECENMSIIKSRNDFMMQIYSVKKRKAFSTVCNKITRKKNRV